MVAAATITTRVVYSTELWIPLGPVARARVMKLDMRYTCACQSFAVLVSMGCCLPYTVAKWSNDKLRAMKLNSVSIIILIGSNISTSTLMSYTNVFILRGISAKLFAYLTLILQCCTEYMNKNEYQTFLHSTCQTVSHLYFCLIIIILHYHHHGQYLFSHEQHQLLASMDPLQRTSGALLGTPLALFSSIIPESNKYVKIGPAPTLPNCFVDSRTSLLLRLYDKPGYFLRVIFDLVYVFFFFVLMNHPILIYSIIYNKIT